MYLIGWADATERAEPVHSDFVKEDRHLYTMGYVDGDVWSWQQPDFRKLSAWDAGEWVDRQGFILTSISLGETARWASLFVPGLYHGIEVPLWWPFTNAITMYVWKGKTWAIYK